MLCGKMVRTEGVEPSRAFAQRILSLSGARRHIIRLAVSTKRDKKFFGSGWRSVANHGIWWYRTGGHGADTECVMSEKITERFVRAIIAKFNAEKSAVVPSSRSNRIFYDAGEDALPGFGLRITAGGAKSFILN